MSSVILKLNSKEYAGWTEVRVSRSLGELCGSFDLGLVDPYPLRPDLWQIELGTPCEVVLDGVSVLTGWVETIDLGYTARDHAISVGGRDTLCDLVDCSWPGPKTEWKDTTPAKVLTDLCAGFGIAVEFEGADVVSDMNEQFQGTFKTQEGSSILAAINRICRAKAVLAVSYGDGDLAITRASTEYAADGLHTGQGGNIKEGRSSENGTDRFSTYQVKAHTQGSDTVDVVSSTQPAGDAVDTAVTRHRPLVVLADSKLDSAGCRQQARWEASIRAAQSRELSYVVQGWKQSNGGIWPMNKLVKVVDTIIGVDSDYLISGIEYSLDLQGTTTEIIVVPPKAFMPQPDAKDSLGSAHADG